jgi:hypothetical protein
MIDCPTLENTISFVEGSRDLADFIASLDRFVHGPLQALNDSIESGDKDLDGLLHDWLPIESQVRKCISKFEMLDIASARTLLTNLAFVPSSFEFHAQRAGLVAGAGLSMIPDTQRALIRLGVAGRHEPRDSHYTIWLWNSGNNRIRFTGDLQENSFANAVVETDAVNNAICCALRTLRGRPQLHAPSTASELAALTHELRQLCLTYQHLRSELSPTFFMRRLRTYLVKYPVAEVLLDGPNAANIASQLSADYLIGFPDPSYSETWARTRLRHMIDTDQAQVERDIDTRPLSLVICDEMKIPQQVFLTLSDYQVAAYIVGQPATFRRTIVEYARLASEAIRLSGIHWSLIISHLIKPASQPNTRDERVLPISPHEGTGGHSHPDTYSIFEMRRKQPIITKLLRAVALLPEGGDDETCSN